MRKFRNKTKNELIEEYSKKDVAWLADNLAECEINLSTLKEEIKLSHYGYNRKTAIDLAVKEQNENLKKILEQNGIRPTLLRLEYLASDCTNCDFKEEDDKCAWVRMYDECPIKTCILTNSFYAYSINDDYFEGISKTFETEHYMLAKAVDERTGDIIYQRE